MHEKMWSRGLRIQTLLLLKFSYEEDGDDKGIPTAFIGFPKGTADDPVARVIARQCALELCSFLEKNGISDVPCYGHEVEAAYGSIQFPF